MSRVEVYAKLKDRKSWKRVCEIRNASRGAWLLWSELEKKYLPSYGEPSLNGEYCSRLLTYDHSAYVEIWDLQYNPNLEHDEKIVFRSTMDCTYVLAEDIPSFLECLKSVGEKFGTNHIEQYEELEKYYSANSENIVAIAYNQTSVCSERDIFGSKMNKPLEDMSNVFNDKDWEENDVF